MIDICKCDVKDKGRCSQVFKELYLLPPLGGILSVEECLI